jgi:hypothetical protein
MPAKAGITTEQQQSAQKTQKEKEDNQSNARSGLHTDLKLRGFIHTLTPNSSKTFIQFRV